MVTDLEMGLRSLQRHQRRPSSARTLCTLDSGPVVPGRRERRPPRAEPGKAKRRFAESPSR